jgi:hypothetical protein
MDAGFVFVFVLVLVTSHGCYNHPVIPNVALQIIGHNLDEGRGVRDPDNTSDLNADPRYSTQKDVLSVRATPEWAKC